MVYLKKLNKVYFILQISNNAVLVIVNIGLKNNITMSIAHIYKSHSIIIKTQYRTINVLYYTIKTAKSIIPRQSSQLYRVLKLSKQQ